MQIGDKLKIVIDSLIPRGGEKPSGIYVSFEEYLSRLSNFNRKLQGSEYRMECWCSICEEHKSKFEKMVTSRESFKASDTKLQISYFRLALRDIKLENEFEMLLYSVTSTLSALTRVIACFLEGTIQAHSHSKLPDILLRHEGFNDSHSLIADACSSWANALINRRDAATHYIALSVTSSLEQSKTGPITTKESILRIGVTKNIVKYASVWEDDLPTIGGSGYERIVYDNGHETHQLVDAKHKVIVRRESPLQNKPEFIDGEEYVKLMYKDFIEYVTNLLETLIPKILKPSSE